MEPHLLIEQQKKERSVWLENFEYQKINFTRENLSKAYTDQALNVEKIKNLTTNDAIFEEDSVNEGETLQENISKANEEEVYLRSSPIKLSFLKHRHSCQSDQKSKLMLECEAIEEEANFENLQAFKVRKSSFNDSHIRVGSTCETMNQFGSATEYLSTRD